MEISPNPKPKPRNPRSLANLKPPFDGTKPGPGRPAIPPEVKAERKALKEMLNAIAPSAIRTLDMSLGSDDERNRLRASEIILSHTVPKLEEVDHYDRPLRELTDEQIDAKLAELNASASSANPGTGSPPQ